ncbi:MAG: type II toxin-antitoxin system Phd/YefM family antitoxin [Gammaproteobacteria bacterium]|nr:type II toxin-antitoxin system Phd/YefM family antitoxin [Gammaproteobacteria bacterium]
MGAISYKRFRKNPDKVIEDVIDAEEAVTVTREDGRDVVIILAKEIESWKETLHLLGSKKNAARLRSAAKEIGAEIARRR